MWSLSIGFRLKTGGNSCFFCFSYKNVLEDYKQQIRAESKTERFIKEYYNDTRIILIYIIEQ